MSVSGRGNVGPEGIGRISGGINRCGLCNSDSEPVGSDGVVCEKCAKAYHPTPQCTGLYKNYIKMMQREGPYGAVRYCCSACRCNTNSAQARSLSNSGNSDSETSDGGDNVTVSQLFVMVKSVVESVASLSTHVASLTTQVAALAALGDTRQSPQPPPFSRDSLYAEMREFDERNKRRDSIIVKGSRAKTDPEIKTVVSRLGHLLLDSEVTTTDVYCVNKQSSMWRVTIKSREARDKLLTNSKNLRGTQMSDIYLSRDLTFKQREEQRAKRATLRNRQNAPSQTAPRRTFGSFLPQSMSSSALPSSSDGSGAVSPQRVLQQTQSSNTSLNETSPVPLANLLDVSGGVSPSFEGFH